MIRKNKFKISLLQLLNTDDIDKRMEVFSRYIYHFWDQLDIDKIEKLTMIYPENMLGFKYKNSLRRELRNINNNIEHARNTN